MRLQHRRRLEYAHEHGINEIVVHAPYIINLANTVKPETYELAVEFLEKEIVRTSGNEEPHTGAASGKSCKCR